MEPEPAADSPSPSENKWIYLTYALISLALMGLSWFANCSQMESASAKIKYGVTQDYLCLINLIKK
jgi:hypothetical protein